MGRDIQALALIGIECKTVKELAERSGTPYSTTKKLVKTQAYQQALREVQKQAFEKGLRKVNTYLSDALEVLHDMILDTSTGDTARVQSCKAIIEASFNSQEYLEIQPLLDKLREGANYEEENQRQEIS